MTEERGQISTEYLILVGFITFIIIGVVSLAFLYSTNINEKIKIDQLQNFFNKVISTAETVYYSGEPAQLSITAYLPKGVSSIEIAEREIIVNVTTTYGEETTSFSSNVPLGGSLDPNEGVKKIIVEAQTSRALISEE